MESERALRLPGSGSNEHLSSPEMEVKDGSTGMSSHCLKTWMCIMKIAIETNVRS
jgi:hypothetical protein